MQDFDGTILFVSHDRYFIDALATQIWAVDNAQLRVYTGNYSAYMEQLREERAEAEIEARADDQKRSKQRAKREQQATPKTRNQETERAELEEEIQQLETRLGLLGRELELASRAQRVDRVYDLGREYANVQEQLQRRLEEWAGVVQT